MDNTLYDWVTYYSAAFSAMVDSLSSLLGVERIMLLDQFRAVHRKYNNSERPFAILELPIVLERYPNVERTELCSILAEPLRRFDAVRSQSLALYPNVVG